MQSAASAFLIGRYDVIAKIVLLLLFLLIPVHHVFFFGVWLRTFLDYSFQISKRRDPPRTFLSIYMCFVAGISLTLSLMLERIYVVRPESSRLLFGIIKEPAQESAENQPSNPADSPPTARPLKSATRLHSLPWLCDRVKTAFGNPPLRDSQHVLVREGPSAQGYR